ncbi:GGDEF domain-containing protein (plasmid) [Streptomycetaceae bacterium NBC_01309]
MPSRTPLRRGHLHPARLAAAAAVPLAALALALADNWRIRRRLEEADRDELTGLPRRQALTARGERLLARRTGDVLVLLLDLDDFKRINDDYGHAAGDQVLDAVAARLLDWTAARGGMAARLGGDEFAAVARVPRRRVHPELETLPTALERPVRYGDHVLKIRVSVGAAHAADLPDASWSTLLRVADVGMYRTKTLRQEGWSTGPCLAHAADANAPTVNGRRQGRPGTHRVPAARTSADTADGAGTGAGR